MSEILTTIAKAAETFEKIAVYLELKGENPFKIRAYRQGAETVRNSDSSLLQKALDGELEGVKGIGKALQDKLHELASTGDLNFWKRLEAEFPPTLPELFAIEGLGPKKIKLLWDELGIASREDLKQAIADDKLSALKGFGAKTTQKLQKAIELAESHVGKFRYFEVAVLAELFADWLKLHPEVNQFSTCGSFRRGKEVVHDLDFLCASNEPVSVIEHFAKHELVDEIIVQGDTKCSVRLENKLQVDLRVVTNEQFPFAQQYFSGSKEHNVQIRSRALKQGYSLNEYALTPKSDEVDPAPALPTERDLYRFLGLDYVEPELRENRGEIEAAEEGKLPKLVELENLRGTFHCHTTASDGKHTLVEMADAAAELGLEYLGISDHSKTSYQANGLHEDRLMAQVEAMHAYNASEDAKIHLFAGSEVDILKDGSLDFADDVLAQLDFVVASVHQSMQLDEATMTARIIRAMENPHVTMLGHVTGRILLRREPYAVNLEKIIDCAAETGTIIELNCSSKRMDMDWRWWRQARDKGVKCSINTDAHSIEGFQTLPAGIKAARKGWLRKEDVINCLSLDAVKQIC